MLKRRSFLVTFKKEVLEFVFEDESNPKSSYATTKKFKADRFQVSKKNIHKWISNKGKIMNAPSNARRFEGGGRESMLGPDIEDVLCSSISEEWREGKQVNMGPI